MNRSEIVAALQALARRLEARGLEADLYVVGGAAIALAYDSRRATRDIDAVFVPKLEVYREAERVAEELGLPVGWLNDASRVSSWVPIPGRWRSPVQESCWS
jgi:hypothetical protein